MDSRSQILPMQDTVAYNIRVHRPTRKATAQEIEAKRMAKKALRKFKANTTIAQCEEQKGAKQLASILKKLHKI